jgi:Ser/Thr protein kinase RdoA (MazF antagonist)
VVKSYALLARADRVSAQLLPRLVRLQRESSAAIARLETQFVHGDFQSKNVVLADDVPWVLDFEHARIDTRLADLYFLLIGDDDGSLVGRSDAFGRALRAYHQTAEPLSDDEITILPDVMAIRATTVLVWWASHMLTGPRRTGRVGAAKSTLRWILDNPATIRDMAIDARGTSF